MFCVLETCTERYCFPLVSTYQSLWLITDAIKAVVLKVCAPNGHIGIIWEFAPGLIPPSFSPINNHNRWILPKIQYISNVVFSLQQIGINLTKCPKVMATAREENRMGMTRTKRAGTWASFLSPFMLSRVITFCLLSLKHVYRHIVYKNISFL